MINPQRCLHVPAVFAGDSPATYRRIFFAPQTTWEFEFNLIQVWHFSQAFGLTATFENIGQNKALKFNKLRQVFICMNAAGTGWSFALIFFASSAAAQPSLYRAIILCDRVPVSVPQNVVFSSFFSTSLSSFLSSCVFFSPLLCLFSGWIRALYSLSLFLTVCHSESGLKKAISCHLVLHAPFALNSTVEPFPLVFSPESD